VPRQYSAAGGPINRNVRSRGRIRNAFVTLSLSAPSRAAFLTGRYNHANGITNNGTPLPDDAVTHATLLREAGYKTADVGKWHMGNQKGARPGFDYSAGIVGQGRHQDGKPTPTKGWVDDVSTDYAIGWIKENKGKPFSLTLGFKSPHGARGGNNLPERLRQLYAGETSRPTPNCGVPAIFHTKELGDVPTSYAVRTATHKLVKYPGHPEWSESFDLKADPLPPRTAGRDGLREWWREANSMSLLGRNGTVTEAGGFRTRGMWVALNIAKWSPPVSGWAVTTVSVQALFATTPPAGMGCNVDNVANDGVRWAAAVRSGGGVASGGGFGSPRQKCNPLAAAYRARVPVGEPGGDSGPVRGSLSQ
jgi:Sulfatase